MNGKSPPAAQEGSGPARIVVVDDHPLLREALRVMLQGQADLLVVGEAEDGEEALGLCRRLRPDLVLMDIGMPKMDGLSATRALKSEFPRTIVLVLTAAEETTYLTEAVKAGAAGYVLKYASKQQLVGAIRRVLEDESPLNQELAMRLLRRLIDERPKTREEQGPAARAAPPAGSIQEEAPTGPAVAGSLSARELEVLRLIARGQTNVQIAKSLLVSTSTVKKHAKHVMCKLGVSDRIQAAVRAVELGLLPEEVQEGG